MKNLSKILLLCLAFFLLDGVVEAATQGVGSYDQTNQSALNNVGQDGTNSSEQGETFRNAYGGTLKDMVFYLESTGGATGNATAEIYATTGTFGTATNLPTGTVLATSDVLDTSTLTASFALKTLDFTGANAIYINPGVVYAAVLKYTDATKIIQIGTDTTVPTYEGNQVAHFSGVWNGVTAGDVIFFVDVTRSQPKYLWATGLWKFLIGRFKFL